MYFVYRLVLGEHEYIGCTNNIRRRKDQHNDNAKSGKSKLGAFLKDNGIVLSVNDFNILKVFEERSAALNFERSTAIEAASNGAKLLNDNYSNECTRKGKNIGNTAKTYVVIDYIAHRTIKVTDLRQFCLINGLKYKQVQRTVNGNKFCDSGIKVFYADEWEAVTDKNFYISGAFVEAIKTNAVEKRVEKTCKMYEVRFPDGHTEEIMNLDRFARQHNLTSGTLHATLINNKPTKGYQVLRRI